MSASGFPNSYGPKGLYEDKPSADAGLLNEMEKQLARCIEHMGESSGFISEETAHACARSLLELFAAVRAFIASPDKPWYEADQRDIAIKHVAFLSHKLTGASIKVSTDKLVGARIRRRSQVGVLTDAHALYKAMTQLVVFLGASVEP